MSAATFVATHCGAQFTGAEGANALAHHMREAHGFKGFKPGAWDPYTKKGAAGWRNGEIEKPTPWVPPRRTATVEQVAARWGDEIDYFDTNDREEIAA